MKKRIVISSLVISLIISNFCFSPKLNPVEKSEITIEMANTITDKTAENDAPFYGPDSTPF